MPGYRKQKVTPWLHPCLSLTQTAVRHKTLRIYSPQDKPKARGHQVSILKHIFSVSRDSQAETGVPNLFKAESAKKPRGLWEHGNQVRLFVRPAETNGDTATAVTFPVTSQWKQLSNFFFLTFLLSLNLGVINGDCLLTSPRADPGVCPY